MPEPLEPAASVETPVPSDPTPRPAVTADSGTRPVLADRLTSCAEVVLCSGLPTQLSISLALVAFGVPLLAPDGGLSLRYVALLSLADSVLLVGLVLVFLRARGESPRPVLFGGRRPRTEGALGILLVPVVFLLVGAVAWAIARWAPGLKNVAENPLASLLRDPRDIAVFAFVVVIAGGVREEVQRAFVLHRFDQHLGGALLGLVLFSLAFGAGHALQGYDAAVMTGALGLFWGWIYLRRRSIVAPMVSHAAFNLIEVLHHGLRS